MEKQLYNILIDAIDEEGPFYQNFYVYGKDSEDSINSIMLYLEKLNYKDIKIVEVELFDINCVPDEIIEQDGLDGYIHNIKYSYPKEENGG